MLSFSMEGRRRVREHILRIDDTFKRNDFKYRPLAGGATVTVLTPEEIQYPEFSGPRLVPVEGESTQAAASGAALNLDFDDGIASESIVPAKLDKPTELQPGHIVIPENTKGWSYRRLFAQHLKGARQITVSDPYVRHFFQARNFMEFLQMIHDLVPEGDEAAVHLITQSDLDTCVRQEEHLNQMVNAFTGSRVAFSWELNHSSSFHARSIVTDTGWKITIDRGLDMFQKFESGPFSVEQAIQEARLTRGAEVSYVRI